MVSLASIDRRKPVRSLGRNPGPPRLSLPHRKAVGQRRRGRGGARERCTHTADKGQVGALVASVPWTISDSSLLFLIFVHPVSTLKLHRLEEGLLASSDNTEVHGQQCCSYVYLSDKNAFVFNLSSPRKPDK